MRQYFNELSKSKFKTRLTSVQEKELVIAAQQGDLAARNKLIEANLPFAVQQAKKMVTFSTDLAQLISAANMGLIKAADKFDPTVGVRFITYAVHQIRASIKEELNNRHLVYTPYSKATAWTTSIDQPVGDTEDLTLADLISDGKRGIDEECIYNDMKSTLLSVLESYDQRTKDVLDAYYNIYTPYADLEQVEEKYNIGSERARNIKNNVIKQLRTQLC